MGALSDGAAAAAGGFVGAALGGALLAVPLTAFICSRINRAIPMPSQSHPVRTEHAASQIPSPSVARTIIQPQGVPSRRYGGTIDDSSSSVTAKYPNNRGPDGEPVPAHKLINHEPRLSFPEYVAWQIHLPDPAPDSAIIEKAKVLIWNLNNFVIDCYRNQPDVLTIDPDLTAQLATVEAGHLPLPLVDLLSRESKITRWLVSRCMAYSLLRRIDPEMPFGESLLPAHLHLIPGPPDRRLSETQKLFRTRAYSQWKQLNWYLYSALPEADEQYHQRRDNIARAFATNMTTLFLPWQSTSGDALSRLESYAIQAAELGILLQSHPTTYNFAWEPMACDYIYHSPNILITRPYMQRITDEHGLKITDPPRLFPPEVQDHASVGEVN